MAGAADIGSNPYSGIEFTALDNSTLTSFDFTEQGSADTVELTTPDLGSVLDSIAVPSTGTNPSTFNPTSLSWSLVSGDTYWLVGVDESNGTFVSSGFTFPDADSDISVTTSEFADGGDVTNSLWADFTDIVTTTTAVPEPGAAALVAAGIAMIALVRGRKRFAARR